MNGKRRLRTLCIYLAGTFTSMIAAGAVTLCFSSLAAKLLAWAITLVTVAVLYGIVWALAAAPRDSGTKGDQQQREAL